MTTTEASASSGPSGSRIGVALMSVRDAAPVRDREHDLLGPHCLGAPAGDDPEQLLGGLAGAAQVLHDACGLAVERDDQGTGPRLEHHDADR